MSRISDSLRRRVTGRRTAAAGVAAIALLVLMAVSAVTPSWAQQGPVLWARATSDTRFAVRLDGSVSPLRVDRFESFGIRFGDERLWVRDPDTRRYGCIDPAGDLVIDFAFYDAGMFSEGLAAVSVRDKKGQYSWGYVDTAGKLVIAPAYDEALEFSEGLAVVHSASAGKYGAIDRVGRQVIPFEYKSLGPFHEGMFPFLSATTGKWGFINRANTIVVKPVYWAVTPFAGGYSTVVGGDRRAGVIDKTGREVLPVRYDALGEYREGLMPVMDKGIERAGYVDRNGDWVIEPRYLDCRAFADGLAAVRVRVGDSNRWGFIGSTGIMVIQPRFTEVCQAGFRDGVVEVTEGSGWGVVDKTGRYLVPPVLPAPRTDDKSMVSQGLIQANLEDVWVQVELGPTPRFTVAPLWAYGLLADGGRVLTANDCVLAQVRSGGERGLVAVRREASGWTLRPLPINTWSSTIDGLVAGEGKDGALVICDTSGAVVASSPPGSNAWRVGAAEILVRAPEGLVLYGRSGKRVPLPDAVIDLHVFRGGLAAVRADGSENGGFVDLDGRLVMPGRFYATTGFSEGLAGVEDRGVHLWGYVDATGEYAIPPRYTGARPFAAGRAAVRSADGWGLIDTSGTVCVPCVYSDASNVEDGLVAAQARNGTWGVVDTAGKVIVPPEYEDLRIGGGLIALRQESVTVPWVLMDAQGRRLSQSSYRDLRIVGGGYAWCRGDYGTALDSAGQALWPAEAYAFTEALWLPGTSPSEDWYQSPSAVFEYGQGR